MESTHSITRAHVQPFLFHETELEVAQNNGDLWISIRRVCEVIGVAFAAQLAKLKGRVWARIEAISATGPDGKMYSAAMLHLDSLPMWLATIEPGRVNPEAREKLALFQTECAKALRDHFFGKPKARHEAEASVVENCTDEVASTEVKLSDAANLPPRAWRSINTDADRSRRSEYEEASYAEKRAIDLLGLAWNELVRVWRIEHHYKAAKVYGETARIVHGVREALIRLDLRSPLMTMEEAQACIQMHLHFSGIDSRSGKLLEAPRSEPVSVSSIVQRTPSTSDVVAALTPKRRTAGEIISASAMGMSAKSLGRVLLRLRGQTFDGKIVCGDVDQTRHQWVWWVEPELLS